MPYEASIGIFFPASWINGFLLAVEVREILKYFSVYRRDRMQNRIGVVVALIADLICVIALMIMSWLYLITHFGETEYASGYAWPIPAYCITSSISALACHLVLLGRIRDLSHYWHTSAAIAPVVAGAFVTGCICTNALATFHKNEHSWSIVWAGVRVGADVLIAAALIYHQQTNRTTIAHTENRFQRAAMNVLSTGSVAAVLSLLTLILFVTRPDTHTGTMFSMVLGRVYTITQVLHLNTRLENRTLSTDDPENAATRSGGDAFGLKSRNGGVRVDRSIVIQADREEHDFSVRTPAVLYTDSSATNSGGRANTYDQDADGMDDVSWDDRKLQGSQVELVK